MRLLATASFLLPVATLHAQWTYDWARQSNSTNVENATNCVVAPDGHVAVTGTFQTDFQIGTFSGDGAPGNGTRGSLSYFDASGAFQWAHVFSCWHQSGANCQAWDVALDGDGNIFVGGQFNDSLFMDGVKILESPDTITANVSVFYVLKFSPAGNLAWAAPIGVEGATGRLLAIAVDGNGDVYAVGRGGNDYGRFDKLDGATGAVLFRRSPNGAGSWIVDVATDANNNVYIEGLATNTFTMGGLSCPYNNALGGGSTPLYIGKFDSNGQAQWYYVPDQTGSGYFGFPNGNLAVSTDGHCFVETRKRVRILGDTLADGNGTTRGLFALNPAGSPIWARKLNTTGQLSASDLRVDSNGDVLVAGESYGPSVNLLDTIIASSTNGLNVFLGRYDGSTGALTKLLNGPAVSEVMGVGLDANNVPTICGTFSGNITMGDALSGPWNVFVTRLEENNIGISEEADGSILMSVFPNPTAGAFQLSLPDSHGAFVAEVLDTRGALVSTERLNAPSASMTLDVPPGLYLLRVRDAAGMMASKRLVVQR